MDWLTLWRGGWPGKPFSLGCPSHLVTLAVLALLVASFPLLRGPGRAALRAGFRYTAAGLLIGVEVLLHLWAYTNGEWNVRTMLPLQLCSVSQYLGAVMLLTRSKRLYQYVYYTAIAGALPALLTPSLVGYGFPHFRFWEYVITHVLIVCAPLYMTLAEGYRPRPGSVGRVIVAMNLFMAFAGGLNWLIGSNYLFLSEKPAGPTPFDYLGPWPWYVVGLEVVGIVTILLLYSPFALRDWRAKQRRAAVRPAADPVVPAVAGSGGARYNITPCGPFAATSRPSEAATWTFWPGRPKASTPSTRTPSSGNEPSAPSASG